MNINSNNVMNKLWGYLRRHPILISIPLVILLWIMVTNFGFIGQTLVAKPGEVGEVLLNATKSNAALGEKVFLHASETIKRAISGWSISVGFGMFLGILLGTILVLYKGSEPIIEFFRSIPPILAFPVFLVAFNYGEAAYIWTIVFGCLPIMILTVARGTQSIPRGKIEILKVHNAIRLVKIFATSMEILPSCFLGARLALSLSIVIAVVTEMVFTPRSGIALGSLAKDAEISFNTPLFYASVVVIGIFGYLANVIMRKLELRLGIRMTETQV